MLLKRGSEGSLKSLSEVSILLAKSAKMQASAPKIYLTLRYVPGILPGSDVCCLKTYMNPMR